MVSDFLVRACTLSLLIGEALVIRHFFGFEVAVLVVMATMWHIMPTNGEVKAIRQVLERKP